MTIPPAIMYLGAQAADKFGSSFSLGFVVLPNVFGEMPAGQFFGFCFFTLLFCSAITSSMSIVQPTMALFQDAFGLTRKKGIALVCLVVLTGTAFVSWFSKNLAALDAFDFWLANFAPFLGGVFQTVLVAYVWKLSNLRQEWDRGAIVKLPKILGPIVKYVSLPYLILIFLFWCYKNMHGRLQEVAENPVTQYSLVFIGVLALGLLATSYAVVRRWKKEDKI